MPITVARPASRVPAKDGLRPLTSVGRRHSSAGTQSRRRRAGSLRSGRTHLPVGTRPRALGCSVLAMARKDTT